MDLLNAVYEETRWKNYIYRFHVDKKGVIIKRIKRGKDQLWSHEIQCQIFDTNEQCFKAMSEVQGKDMYVSDIAYAQYLAREND